ncbi:MAG TPA: hypothetical protein VKA60_12005 [Blastocatellia bacterium]|nr:hypothetical protein [Blastocatellia bacterium]
MVEKPNKQQPAIIGGLVMGLLTSIPVVNLGNFCCCLWLLLGGALAARLLIKRSPVWPVSSGDGATTGAIAGAVGAGVYLLIGVPLGLMLSHTTMSLFGGFIDSIKDPQFREAMRKALEQAQNQPLSARIMSALFNWLISACLMVGMGMLGGLIGVALFEKRKGGPPPPAYPPQNYPPGYGPAGYGAPPGQS